MQNKPIKIKLVWNDLASIAEIKLPSLPNFILTPDGQRSIPIHELSDETLRELGAVWTEELVMSATLKRAEAKQRNVG